MMAKSHFGSKWYWLITSYSRNNRFGGEGIQSFIWGLLFTLAFFYLLMPVFPATFAEKFVERGWMPIIASFLFFWAVAILIEKTLLLVIRKSRQKYQLNFGILTEIEEAIQNALEKVRTTSDELKEFIIGDRLKKALVHFSASRDLKEVSDILREESETDFAEMESSYALIRVFLWTIPILGFIGTVIGVGDAVGGFSSFLSQAQEIDQIKNFLGEVTTGLSAAFDSTFVALALSVVLMMLMFFVEKREKNQLQAAERYCYTIVVEPLAKKRVSPQDNNQLLESLTSLQADSKQVQNTLQSFVEHLYSLEEKVYQHLASPDNLLTQTMRELVPNMEVWKNEAQALSISLSESLSNAWQKTSSEWFNSINLLREEIGHKSSEQQKILEQIIAERQLFYQMTEEQRDKFKALLDSNDGSLKDALEIERETITKAVESQAQYANQYTEAVSQISQTQQQLITSHIDEIAKLTQTQQQLITLQNKLENELIRVAGSEGLLAAIQGLRQMLQQLDPALQKLANQPIDVKVNFTTAT
ncbi:MAG: hypothetical protein DRR08_11750 [Candidatus Parabeggiatoa sp. nov. 2]|nr:MAG: hypothetical protein B6247_21460 [Beggiatoa sp. 4572_84]RKZ60277.1 MAG: hypothetical protein DRR08_11750 [Gammaproteobacteria bacterium]